ncbi:type I restriction-modification system subunit M N-terminal domain-containing protein [Kibdelosporangium phytohabitans]|uniref:N6 adenine-specific DNA methyltransferase N-terminal domain-containing protein n=1 Tax=Kibdelosporangium phytohabitans TaxID=860235 RepID=A0A0N9ICK5_9PSEU|nr:type I restriction-modification system subunit M N-terminal domain-containing protein [Kibdelosporangium phytohabitans]ALG12345.1 hypothetical protein AOZ06_40700 [Kibdelosporangium phytohabitans]MBE1463911.1 hypothetical protein [Kibdelosporangium phytohabitans]
MVESSSTVIKNHATFIWSVADLLRGDYKQSEYGKVILRASQVGLVRACRGSHIDPPERCPS